MACNEQDIHEAEQESVDNAQVAMADNGHIDLNSLQWTREPKNFEVKGDTEQPFANNDDNRAVIAFGEE